MNSQVTNKSNTITHSRANKCKKTPARLHNVRVRANGTKSLQTGLPLTQLITRVRSFRYHLQSRSGSRANLKGAVDNGGDFSSTEISKVSSSQERNISKRGAPDLFQLSEGGATTPSCPLNPPLLQRHHLC